jgi:hypothetical protein
MKTHNNLTILIMSTLLELFEENGYPGFNRFWGILQDKGLTSQYKRKQVEEFVANQKVTQLHKRPVAGKSTPITAPSFGFSYQMDLLDVSSLSRSNSGMHWLVLMIDIFTRKIAIAPVPNKKPISVLVGIKDCMKQMGREPSIIQSDKGSEWKESVAKFFKENTILVKQAEVGDHNSLGVVDSASRLVKNWIHKHITFHQNERFIDDLPRFVKAYNNTKHSVLDGLSPNQAVKFPTEVRRSHFLRVTSVGESKPRRKRVKKMKKFAIGDHVRVLRSKTAFQRGYEVKYSLTVHTIEEIHGLNYVLENGKYYRADRLLKVPAPEATPVADVGRKAKFEHRTKTLLKSDGIDERNVPIRRSARERKPESQLQDVRYGKIVY